MDIKVPAMGESVTEGTLANWLVKPGQVFSRVHVEDAAAAIAAAMLRSEGLVVNLADSWMNRYLTPVKA